MKDICFGVDVGGTTVKMGLFETGGRLLNSFEIVTRKEDHGKNVLPDIAQAIEKELNEQNISKERVAGIGIGVPGPVLDDGTVNKCVNIGWDVINIAKELGNLTGLKVKVGNDATVAALGEAWQGGGKGYGSMAMFTLGTGVGGGIIVNGKPVNGCRGAGGEVGHMFVVYDEEETCNCGKKGCLEQVASATGIVRMARRMMAQATETTKLTKYEDLTAKNVLDEAKNGDAVAMQVLENLGKYLGIAMAHTACVVDPEVFVLGGGVSKAGKILIDVVEKNYRQYAFHASREAKITLATLGNDAGMYGAARLVIEE
ncbi:MAG: ROK family glucokinase [Lachnospiraceae bacterium]